MSERINYTLASSPPTLRSATNAAPSTTFRTLSAYSPAVMILGPIFAPSTASNPTLGCVSFVITSVVTGNLAEASFITVIEEGERGRERGEGRGRTCLGNFGSDVRSAYFEDYSSYPRAIQSYIDQLPTPSNSDRKTTKTEE